MTITRDDLKPGAVFKVRNQGTNITPETVEVTVHWVGPTMIHYFVGTDRNPRPTSIERFLEIVNA